MLKLRFSLGLTYNFDIKVFVEHDVLRFEISVHDLLRFEVVQHADKLGRKETNKIEIEFPYTKRDQTESARVVKGVGNNDFDDKWYVCCRESD